MSTCDPILATHTLSSIPPCSTPCSPHRVKFWCSHGGKILPHPTDSHLKYFGGETRVISASRDISLKELMEKLCYLIHGKTILKYQVRSEDLDTLVSVKSEEDVRHMFNEIDHHERVGSHKLRAFLFPANPVVVEESATDRSTEQRYIDAVNGIIRAATSFYVRPFPPSSGSGITEPSHNRLHLQKLHSCSHLPTHCHNNGLSNYQFPRPISDSYLRPNCQQLTHKQSRGSCPFLNGKCNNANDVSMRSAPTSPRFSRTESRYAMRSAPSSPPHGHYGPYGLAQQDRLGLVN